MTSAPKPTASRVLQMALGGMVVIVADGVAAAVLAALTYLISPSIITTTRGITVGCLEVTLAQWLYVAPYWRRMRHSHPAFAKGMFATAVSIAVMTLPLTDFWDAKWLQPTLPPLWKLALASSILLLGVVAMVAVNTALGWLLWRLLLKRLYARYSDRILKTWRGLNPTARELATAVVLVWSLLFLSYALTEPKPFWHWSHFGNQLPGSDFSPGFGSLKQFAILLNWPAIRLIAILEVVLVAPFYLVYGAVWLFYPFLFVVGTAIAVAVMWLYWFGIFSGIRTLRAKYTTEHPWTVRR